MSLQDMIILQNKCEELEEKLAVAEKKIKSFDAYVCRDEKLKIAIEALEELNEKHGLNYWADICDIAKEALEKITK
jgi:hypothetical protein